MVKNFLFIFFFKYYISLENDCIFHVDPNNVSWLRVQFDQNEITLKTDLVKYYYIYNNIINMVIWLKQQISANAKHREITNICRLLVIDPLLYQ